MTGKAGVEKACGRKEISGAGGYSGNRIHYCLYIFLN
jgi:hypothetical protein